MYHKYLLYACLATRARNLVVCLSIFQNVGCQPLMSCESICVYVFINNYGIEFNNKINVIKYFTVLDSKHCVHECLLLLL